MPHVWLSLGRFSRKHFEASTSYSNEPEPLRSHHAKHQRVFAALDAYKPFLNNHYLSKHYYTVELNRNHCLELNTEHLSVSCKK